MLDLPRRLVINVKDEQERANAVLKAMGSETRLQILELLSDRICNISEIAEALGLPFSTANLHINTLEKAGLLLTEYRPAVRGLQKVCARAYNTIVFHHSYGGAQPSSALEQSMPIGTFASCHVTPTCGMASESGIIGLFDDPVTFYEPERVNAQVLWFHDGYVEYHFPNRLPPSAAPANLRLSFEVCSEAPLHHEDWPSEITVWVNAIEIGTWMSPADFGNQRGTFTPSWWENHNSQYGLLKVWQVDEEGSMIDGMRVSNVTLADLKIQHRHYIAVRIGVKEDARHRGGINIFGRAFGNYPQDIVLNLRY